MIDFRLIPRPDPRVVLHMLCDGGFLLLRGFFCSRPRLSGQEVEYTRIRGLTSKEGIKNVSLFLMLTVRVLSHCASSEGQRFSLALLLPFVKMFFVIFNHSGQVELILGLAFLNVSLHVLETSLLPSLHCLSLLALDINSSSPGVSAKTPSSAMPVFFPVLLSYDTQVRPAPASFRLASWGMSNLSGPLCSSGLKGLATFWSYSRRTKEVWTYVCDWWFTDQIAIASKYSCLQWV